RQTSHGVVLASRRSEFTVISRSLNGVSAISPLMLRCQTSPSMWQSTISCSLDYTFISFEMVTYYGSDRFASCDAALPSLALREKSLQGKLARLIGHITRPT